MHMGRYSTKPAELPANMHVFTSATLPPPLAENLPSFLGGQSQCDVTRDEGPWLQHTDAKAAGCAQEAHMADAITAAVPSECTLVGCAVQA
jgi:hypothetical protein